MKKVFFKYIIVFIIIYCILAIIPNLIISRISNNSSYSNKEVNISKYDTEIELNNDNTCSVTEHISINWSKEGHNSFHRIIPTYSKNNLKKMDLSSLYSTDQITSYRKLANGNYYLQVGSTPGSLSIGLHTYEIKYNVNFGKDYNKGFDEFIFYAYGDNWNTNIKNPSFKITLPSQVEKLDIKFYSDKLKKNDISKSVDYGIEGNIVNATLKDSYKVTGPLTIDIILPDGYFTNETNIYPNISAYISLFTIVVFLTFLVLWIRYNKEIKIETHEGYPPSNLDASQIGFIDKNSFNSKKLSVALLASLHQKGYIKIYDTGNYNYLMLNLLVENRDNLRNEESIELPDEIDFVSPSSNNLVSLSKNEQLIYDKLFKKTDVNLLKNDENFYEVFNEIENQLKNNTGNKTNDNKTLIMKFFSWFFAILSIILMVLASYIIKDVNPKLSITLLLGWTSSILSLIFTFTESKKPLYGKEIKNKINSFKDFIENISKDKLENLIEKDPKYFYKISPYAYSLNIYKKWLDCCSNIEIPEDARKELETFNYYDPYAFDHIADNISYYSSDTNSSNNDK
ncbi:MAG: DUF2207 domain-containing protein [Clostridia bacterium]|nr:DUF2207 domain-containing protein [Clostridia bacterium]